MKKRINHLLLSLLAACIFIPVQASDNPLARDTGISLSAYIDGDSPLYLIDSSSSTKLTDTWVQNDVKTLHLDINLSGADKSSKFVEVTVPIGMKINSNPNEYVNGVTIGSVDTTKFAKEKISSSNGYTHTPNAGTIKFNVLENTQSLSLDLLVAVDNKFWDTVENSPANDPIKKSIEVTVGDNSNRISKKLDTVYTKGRTWSSYVDSNVTSYIESDKTVTISTSLTMDYVQTTTNRLYGTVTTRMDIPYTVKTENGVSVKKYAEVQNVVVNYGGTYEIKDNQIIVTYKNAWLSVVSYYVYLNFDSSIFKPNDIVTYQYADLNVNNYFTNVKTNLLPLYTKSIRIAPDVEQVSIASSSISAFNNGNESIISHFGYFQLVNTGALSSNKRITFDFPYGSGSGVGVTTVRIPTNTPAQTLKIDCVLWERGTNKEYSGTVTINKAYTGVSDGYLLTVTNIKNSLNLGSKELYFKQIKYIFGKVPFNYQSYVRSAGHATSSSGNTWGKVFFNAPSGAYYTSSMTLESLDSNSAVTGSSKTSQNTTISATGQAPAYIASFNFYNTKDQAITEINSGRDFSIKGNFSMAAYPYTNTGYMDKPVVLIKVPEGFTIDKGFTKFTSSNNISKALSYNIANENNPRKLSNGEIVYEIEILNQGFGYYSENLGIFNSINYEIRLSISKKVKTLSLNGRGMISIEDKYVKANAGGSYDRWYIPDTWDANGNGSSLDRLATISADMFLNVNSNTSSLDADFFVSVNGSTYTRDSAMLMSPDDNLVFKFSIDNIHEGYVPKGEFEYTVTIPKNDNPTFGFSLELTSFVQEISSFEILYSTDGTNYYPKNSISNIKDVRAIKFKSLIQIEDEFKHDFLIRTKYTNGSYNKKCFFVSSMVSGYQTYKKGTSSNRIFQILDLIYTFIDNNSEKPVIKSPVKNSLCELDRSINVNWTHSRSNQMSSSVVSILDSGNNKLSSSTINGNSTNGSISLSKAGGYYITVTNYNLFDVPSTSEPVYVRYGIYDIEGNATTKEISLPNTIKYVAILADRDIPEGTSITARIYYTTNTSGNVVVSNVAGTYVDVPISNTKSVNPEPIMLPKATSKIKVRFILKNLKTTNLKNTPVLDYIQVLAR